MQRIALSLVMTFGLTGLALAQSEPLTYPAVKSWYVPSNKIQHSSPAAACATLGPAYYPNPVTSHYPSPNSACGYTCDVAQWDYFCGVANLQVVESCPSGGTINANHATCSCSAVISTNHQTKCQVSATHPCAECKRAMPMDKGKAVLP